VLDAIVVGVYFLLIVIVGVWVGKFTKTTADFFFGGRRFAWWLVGFSCVATLVGSYSFIQYAQVGFNFGMPSLGPYTNEWFILPLFLIVWLPIIYYNNIQSIPEYFEKRFDRRTRIAVIIFLLAYLIGYIGINLLTIGVAMKGIVKGNEFLQIAFGYHFYSDLWTMGGFLDWELIIPATVIAVLSGLYLHSGGQTSVLVTDLIQGVLLLLVGLGVVWVGIDAVGGLSGLWEGMPLQNRLPFAKFNEPATYNAVGDFWNDATVGTFAFYCINQGVLMRFLSAKSVRDGKKAMLFVVVVLMPLAAIAVGGAGWIGRAMVSQGLLEESSSREIFIAVSQALCGPGFYGLVVAAVVAALMSTLDTLITAVSAVIVNDIARPLKPNQPDSYYLRLAKRSSIVVTVFGVCLIPIFDQFESIYRALSHFTSIVLPPLVVVTICGIMWKRFHARAAFWSLILGAVLMFISIFYPQVITPLAHGISAEGGYSYIRSFYGIVTTSLAVIVFMALWWNAKQKDIKLDGLVVGRLQKAMETYKGGKPSFVGIGKKVLLGWESNDDLDEVRLPRTALEKLSLSAGDIIYMSDARLWLGGLRSVHAKVGSQPSSSGHIELPPSVRDEAQFKPGKPVLVEKIL